MDLFSTQVRLICIYIIHILVDTCELKCIHHFTCFIYFPPARFRVKLSWYRELTIKLYHYLTRTKILYPCSSLVAWMWNIYIFLEHGFELHWIILLIIILCIQTRSSRWFSVTLHGFWPIHNAPSSSVCFN